MTSLSELYFRCRRFYLVSTNKKVFSKAVAQAAENHGDKEAWLDIYEEGYIYMHSSLDPLTKFSSTPTSTEFKDIFQWKIPQMITKTIPIHTRIKLYNKKDEHQFLK